MWNGSTKVFLSCLSRIIIERDVEMMEQNAHCSSSRQCIIVALGSESEKQGEEDSVSNKKETWWDSSWFTSEKLNSLSIKDRSVQMMTCGPNPILNQDAKWFDEKKLVRHVVTSMMSEQSLWGLIVIITEDSSQNRVNTILMESCQEQKVRRKFAWTFEVTSEWCRLGQWLSIW